MEAFLIIPAVVALVLWAVWMISANRRSEDRQLDEVKRALEKRGASDVFVRRVTDANGGVKTFEATYTDMRGLRWKIACMVSGEHLFWSDPRPVFLLPGGTLEG